jgi:hypothetical protein
MVGLEARREFDLGELRQRRRATLPVLAGIGGMAVPVVIFLALNPGQDSALLLALGILGGIVLLRLARIRFGLLYFLLAAAAWVALQSSGIEPVVLGWTATSNCCCNFNRSCGRFTWWDTTATLGWTSTGSARIYAAMPAPTEWPKTSTRSRSDRRQAG